jgi:hypothetical protein
LQRWTQSTQRCWVFVASKIVSNAAIKVWLHLKGMTKQTINRRMHYSPFVDLFFFNIMEMGQLEEVTLWP